MRRTNRTIDAIAWSAVIIIGIVAILKLQARVEAVESEAREDLELLYIPDQRVLHGLALGDDNTAADLLWIRSIFYIAAYHNHYCPHCSHTHDHDGEHDHKNADHHQHEDTDPGTLTSGESSTQDTLKFADIDFRQVEAIRKTLCLDDVRTEQKQLSRLLNTVTNLDPMFVTPYYEGAVNLSLIGGRYEEAIQLINKGISHRQDRWELYYFRGFLHLFYLNDKEGAARDIQTAAMLPNAPIIIIKLAASINVGLNRRELALEFLRTLYEETGDEGLKEKILGIITEYNLH